MSNVDCLVFTTYGENTNDYDVSHPHLSIYQISYESAQCSRQGMSTEIKLSLMYVVIIEQNKNSIEYDQHEKERSGKTL